MSESTTYRYTHTRLLVADFGACFRFYRDTIGLKVHSGDEAGPYAEFDAGAVILSLFGDTAMSKVLGRKIEPCKDCPQVVLCVRTSSVQKAYEELKGRGVNFVTPPTDHKDWSIRTAHFADPDGNLIEINEKI